MLRPASCGSSRTRARPAGSTSGSSSRTASAPRWCRSTRSATRASRACSSATCRRSRPTGAPPITQPRDLLRRAAERLHHRRRAAEPSSTIPTGEGDEGGAIGTRDALDGDDRHHARQRRSMRLLFALRFRDLDLLISDQVTHEQPAAVPSLAERPADPDRAVPALRQGPVPRHRRRRPDGLRPGRVHDRPTASRTPRGSTRPSRSTGRGSAASRSTTSGTASRSRSTPTTARCTSTSPTRTTRSSGPTPASSPTCSSRSTRCRPTCATHLRVPEELFNVQTRVFGRYHVTNAAAVLPRGTTCGRCPTASPARRRCRPRRTTSRCGCRARRMSSSCSSSRWSRPTGRT